MRICCIVLLLLTQGFEDRNRATEQRLVAAINEIRTAHRLRPLRWNERIAGQARHHSERMFRHHFMSHDDPELGGPGDRLNAAGISWRACGENIYQGFGRDPVQSAIHLWMQSSGHRRNILSATYTDTGIGVAINRDGEYWITQMFAVF